MQDKKELILKEIKDLDFEGQLIFFSELARHDDKVDKKVKAQIDQVREKLNLKTPFNAAYQSWYSRALPVVKQIADDRYEEFKELYSKDRKGKPIDFLSYTISDYLIGLAVKRGHEQVVNPLSALSAKFQQQLNIFSSLLSSAQSSIANIEGALQANLFDNELEAAEQLLARKHIRAAGALAGVTLERHLASVCKAHHIKISKRNPGIADYNDALKDGGVIELAVWRYIQFLADVRNSSVHIRGKEPEHDQVEGAIAGVKEIIKKVL